MRDLERARQKAAHNAAKRAAGGATDAGSVIAQERRAADVARSRRREQEVFLHELLAVRAKRQRGPGAAKPRRGK